MSRSLGKLAVALLVFAAASNADAGIRYWHTNLTQVPYYPGYFPFYAPQVATPSVPTSASGMQSHTLVPATCPDGTPSLAAYHPASGTFLGWWQLLGGVWQFVNSDAANGGGGGGSTSNGVTRTEFNQFVTEYKSDIGEIKTKLGISTTPAGGNSAGGNPPGTGGTPGGAAGNTGGTGGTTPAPTTGPQTGTATVPQGGAAPKNAAAQPVAKPAVERIDDIIHALDAIKIKK